MLIRRIDGSAIAETVATVESYEKAREYLEGLGKVIFWERDHRAGGADALVIPRGFLIPEQYSVEVVS